MEGLGGVGFVIVGGLGEAAECVVIGESDCLGRCLDFGQAIESVVGEGGGRLRCFFGGEVAIGIVGKLGGVGGGDDLIQVVEGEVVCVARESVVK